MKISIIIPLLNESENIKELVSYLNMNCKNASFESEVVFVDDGSTDNSVELLKSQKFDSFNAKIIKLSKNYGSHNALRAGILNANSNICVFFSADMQEPFEALERMHDEIRKGADIVCAYKKNVSIGGFSKLFSRLYAKLIRKFAVKNFPIEGVNNIMFNLKIKNKLNENIEKNSSIFLQIINMGFKSTFIPYSLSSRKHGKSKWTFGKKLKLFIDSFINFSYLPIRTVTILGMILSCLSVIFAILMIIYKLFINISVPLGYPTIIIVLLLGFGITNISIGIVAEYIWRILDTTRQRPTFIIDTIEEIQGGEQ